MKFKVLAGKHHDGDKTYTKGQVVTTETDLSAVFANKFERVISEGREGPKSSKGQSSKPEKGPKGKPVAASDKGGAIEVRGSDVTDEFPLAEEECFKVYKKDKLYHVFESEEEMAPVKGGEGLKRDAVEAFIKKHLDE